MFVVEDGAKDQDDRDCVGGGNLLHNCLAYCCEDNGCKTEIGVGSGGKQFVDNRSRGCIYTNIFVIIWI